MRRCGVLCFLLFGNMQILESFHLAVSGEISQDVRATFDALRDATTKPDADSVIAYAMGDAFSGAIGAFASRKGADSLGDVKKDSLLTKIGATSAFFGTRSIVRSTEALLGVPRPLILITAPAIALFASESAKAIGRGGGVVLGDANNLSARDGRKEVLDLPEITGDITKWLIYDTSYGVDPFWLRYQQLLLNEQFDFSSLIEAEVSSVGIGAGAATIGAFVNKLLHKEKCISDTTFSELGKVSLEGALLFGVYQVTLDLLHTSVPDFLNFKLIFSFVTDALEAALVSS